MRKPRFQLNVTTSQKNYEACIEIAKRHYMPLSTIGAYCLDVQLKNLNEMDLVRYFRERQNLFVVNKNLEDKVQRLENEVEILKKSLVA